VRLRSLLKRTSTLRHKFVLCYVRKEKLFQPASAFTASAFTASAFTTSAIESEPKPFDSVIVAVVPLDERELQVLLLQGKLLLTIACRVLLCEQLQFLRTGSLPL